MTDTSGARTLAFGGLGGASLLVIGTALAATQPVVAAGSPEVDTLAPIVVYAPAVADPQVVTPTTVPPSVAAVSVEPAPDQAAIDRFLASLEPAPPAPTTPPATAVAETEGS